MGQGLGRVGVATSLIGLLCGYIAAWTDQGVPRKTVRGMWIKDIVDKHVVTQTMLCCVSCERATGNRPLCCRIFSALCNYQRAAVHPSCTASLRARHHVD